MLASRFVIRVGLLLGILVLPLWATLDQNGDGVSDIWSALHPNATPPGADTDGDGAANKAEAVAGTDATSAASRFAATPQVDASGNLVLRWPSIAGKHYRIESTTDLRTWTQQPDEFIGDDTELSSVVRNAGSAGSGLQFWRVVVFDLDSDGDGFNDWEEVQLGTDPTRANFIPPSPILRVDFEAEEGYARGLLAGQMGWEVPSGTAEVLAVADAPSGQQIATVSTDSEAIWTLPLPQSGVVYVEFHAQLGSTASYWTTAQLIVGGSKIALQATGDSAELWTCTEGNWYDSYNWNGTSHILALNSDGRSAEWHRFTLRIDTEAGRLDVAVDGTVVAMDCRSEPRPISQLFLRNQSANGSRVDQVKVFVANPLFVDADCDGIPDEWETLSGIDPRANDRESDPDGDGRTNLQEYLAGTDPGDFYNGNPPSLSVESGGNQTAAIGEFNAHPIVFLARNPADSTPWADAVIDITVDSGGGELAQVATDMRLSAPLPALGTLSKTLHLRTSDEGTVSVFFLQPNTIGFTSRIRATAGASFVEAQSVSAPPVGGGSTGIPGGTGGSPGDPGEAPGPGSPPTAPTAPTMANMLRNTFSLSWDASMAAAGHSVARYVVYLNGKSVASTSGGTSATVAYDPNSTLLQVYTVCAVDNTGLVSASSEALVGPRMQNVSDFEVEYKTAYASDQVDSGGANNGGENCYRQVDVVTSGDEVQVGNNGENLTRSIYEMTGTWRVDATTKAWKFTGISGHHTQIGYGSKLDGSDSLAEQTYYVNAGGVCVRKYIVYDDDFPIPHDGEYPVSWDVPLMRNLEDWRESIRGNSVMTLLEENEQGDYYFHIGYYYDGYEHMNGTYSESGLFHKIGTAYYTATYSDPYTEGDAQRDLGDSVGRDYALALSHLGECKWSYAAVAQEGEVSIVENVDQQNYRLGIRRFTPGTSRGTLSGGQYRLKSSAKGWVTFHWAEVLIPAGGAVGQILEERTETVFADANNAVSQVYDRAPPSTDGQVVILPWGECAVMSAAEIPAAQAVGASAPPVYVDLYTPCTMAPGELIEVDSTLNGYLEYEGQVLTAAAVQIAGDVDSIDLVVVALADVEMFGVLNASKHLGVSVHNGTDLYSIIKGDWRMRQGFELVAVGKTPGVVTITIRATILGQQVESSQTITVSLNADLAVDANRDGTIKLPSEDASDATAADKPFRFWLNDDIDRGHTVDKTDFEEDDLSLKEAGTIADCKTADWQNNQILAKRDLEDFARLWISMQGLSAAFLPKGYDDSAEADLYMGLQWADTTGSPAIKIYPAAEIDGGAKYLTDEAVATEQIGLDYAMNDFRDPSEQVRSAMNVIQGTDFFVIPPRYFGRLTEASPKTFFLFEGVTAGKGQLKLVILKKEGGAFTKIGEGPGVWMDLKKVDEFYERWTVGDTGGGAPWSAALRKRVTLDSQSTFTGHSDGFAYASDAPEEMKYILYVHGWNMEPWEKNRYAETMFKRLYWQGYKGRFGAFCWPTAYGFDGPMSLIRDGTNYDRSEWAAWRAAMPLKNLLVSLHSTYGNQVHVLAHSMGNVATGEALELASLAGTGKIVATYVATQAAITAHCYDGAQPDNLQPEPFGGAIARSWDGAWPQTPNIYKDWLTGNGAAATTRVNFYNVNDYALWHDLWEANQYFKPDGVDLPDQPYTYKFYHDPEGSNPDNFAKLDGTMHPLTLGDRYTLHDRYEIMSFAAEARCRAVGATPSSLTLGDSLDLQSIWPADNGIKLHEDVQPGGLAFSAHRWHSAQFRSTNMRQQRYWKALLGSRGFQIITTP